MKNKLITILSFVLLFFFFFEAKSQTLYSQKLKKYLETAPLNNVRIDSINRNLDTFILFKGTNENLLVEIYHLKNIAHELNYKQGEADAICNISRHYILKNKTSYALKFYLQALSINEDANDSIRQAKVCQQIGVIYYEQKNYIIALKYFRQSSALYNKKGQNKNQSLAFYLLGLVDRDLHNYDSSKYFFNEGIKLKYISRDTQGLKESFMEMAFLYIQQNLADSALAAVNSSSIYCVEEKSDHAFLTRKYNVNAKAYLIQQKYEEAMSAAKICLKEALVYRRGASLVDAYQICFQSAAALNNFKLAYEYQNRLLIIKDSLFSDEKIQELSRIESTYYDEKKQTRINMLEVQEKLQKKLNYSFVAGILLLVLLSILLYNRIRTKQRTNNIITLQKNLVEKKNNEITQSINYAKRIQNAILPSDYLIRQNLPNSFILYKPKDIVAGDFYWMEVTGDVILFAACDCTGHGVPGALVSVVCHNALNRAVREFGLTQPAAILNKTADLVIENFSKGQEEIKDGMDISLCSYNTKTKQLEWAGANNPLWIVNKANENNMENNHISIIQDNYQLTEIIADKQSIGHDISKHIYTNHSISINNGDIIYLFTDGFADQFGGPTGQKKLTRKRFKSLLLSIQNNSIQSQGVKLDEFFAEYRNKEEQIDDILVMGIKF